MSGNERKVPVRLSDDELGKIRAHLRTLACSEAWVDAILHELLRSDARGRRVVKYKTDGHGRLKPDFKRAMPKLLVEIAKAGIYPPAADDRARGGHRGSQMRRCVCRHCTRPLHREARIEDRGSRIEKSDVRDSRSSILDPRSFRHVLWPAHYVQQGLSYSCAVAHAPVDPFFADANPEMLRDAMGCADVAEQVHYDAEAWREDQTAGMIIGAADSAMARLEALNREEAQSGEARIEDRESKIAQGGDQRHPLSSILDPLSSILDLPLLDPRSSAERIALCNICLLNRPAVLTAIAGHRWRQVVGEVQISNGREINNVRRELRGLNNLGSLADYLEMGHSLREVIGLTANQADLIAELVEQHPKEPRRRYARLPWQQTRLGRRRKNK